MVQRPDWPAPAAVAGPSMKGATADLSGLWPQNPDQADVELLAILTLAQEPELVRRRTWRMAMHSTDQAGLNASTPAARLVPPGSAHSHCQAPTDPQPPLSSMEATPAHRSTNGPVSLVPSGVHHRSLALAEQQVAFPTMERSCQHLLCAHCPHCDLRLGSSSSVTRHPQ